MKQIAESSVVTTMEKGWPPLQKQHNSRITLIRWQKNSPAQPALGANIDLIWLSGCLRAQVSWSNRVSLFPLDPAEARTLAAPWCLALFFLNSIILLAEILFFLFLFFHFFWRKIENGRSVQIWSYT